MTLARVAITGLGVIAPQGDCLDTVFTRLAAGESAIGYLPASLSAGLRSPIAGQIAFDGAAHFPAPRLRLLDRVSQLALCAAEQAVADASIDFAAEAHERCGVFVGTGMGGAQTTEDGYHTLYAQASDRIKPNTVIGAMANAAASWIGIEYGLTGPNLTYSTACSSSAVAIGEAARRIQHGDTDVMIAGGTEAPLCVGVLRAWDAMRVLATPDESDVSASCRPFSLGRTGLVLSEGAAFVILESEAHALSRGARVHAFLGGYGLATDAAHITRPAVEGQARAMRAALRSGGFETTDIGYINAHGTATQQNDAVESAAIKEVFGEHAGSVPVSSTKSMHGHLLGAAGALEFVISVAALERGIAPPTMHLRAADPECDLDYVPHRARKLPALRAVMSNSFAFGGTNAVLIATRDVGQQALNLGRARV